MVKTIDNIKALVIPTGGNAKEDLERAHAAIHYARENNLDVPYLISGLGPDTNIALNYDENKTNKNLDFHEELYNFMMKNTDEFIGVDINSTNSIENVLFTFPKGTAGKYPFFTYDSHGRKFKILEKYLKEKGEISEDLELIHISTGKGSPFQKVYGNLALMYLKGSIDSKKFSFLKNIFKFLFRR